MPGPSTDSTEILVAFVAAVAAALAALIAGGVSLLGLLTSKEEQVSEFRQAWIDALRADLASLVARAFAIQSYYATVMQHRPPPTVAECWGKTREDYLELNQVSTRIKLRLNATETESGEVLNSLREMEALFKDLSHSASTQEIDRIVTDLERKSPPLLKKEWERVKTGEPVYRTAKGITLGFFIVAALLAAVLFCKFPR